MCSFVSHVFVCIHVVSHLYAHIHTPEPVIPDICTPLRLIRRVNNPALPPQIARNADNILRDLLQRRRSLLVLLIEYPRKLLCLLLHVHLRLRIPQRPSQLLALLALRVPVRNTRDIRRSVDAQRALLAVDFARRKALVALGLVDLHAEAVVLQQDDAAAVDSRAADEGDVSLGFGRSEEGDCEGHGVDADVDERSAGEVEGEDVGCLAGEDIVVARAVRCVGQAGAVYGSQTLLLVDFLAEELEVCFLDVAEGFDQEDFVFFCGREEVVELGRRAGCGFLEDDVLAGLQELFGVGVVVGVGRGDVDSLHALVGGEVFEGSVGCLAVEFGGEGFGLFLLARVDGVELPLAVFGGCFDEGLGDPARADGSECDGHDWWCMRCLEEREFVQCGKKKVNVHKMEVI
jgi:hypothetical protein